MVNHVLPCLFSSASDSPGLDPVVIPDLIRDPSSVHHGSSGQARGRRVRLVLQASQPSAPQAVKPEDDGRDAPGLSRPGPTPRRRRGR